MEQAAAILEGIDAAAYSRPAELLDGQKIGGHVRHVIEFYEAILRGVPEGRIDYDARRRDPLLESDCEAAVQRLRGLATTLRGETRLRGVRPLWVASEGADFAESTIARELQAVASHSVHHFALIAVLLRYQGYTVPADFGVSQATLEYRARTREAA